MAYQRFAPPAAARGLIEHLWVVREPVGTTAREVLLPDGHGLVLVELGEPGVRIDPLTGVRAPDESGVRGLATHAVVREQAGPAVRLGAQLGPLTLARLAPGNAAVDRAVPLDVLVADPAPVRAALEAGRDADAARLLAEAVAARRAPATEDPAVAALEPVVREAANERGLVTTAELARRADLALGALHRDFSVHVGVSPATYLAAVRFSSFVRESVGAGPAGPAEVLAAIRWYAQAGYPPREVERFTGLTPLALRRVEQGIADALGVPA